MPGNEHVLEISHLKFSYGAGPAVIDIPSFCLGAGERLFLHGPSGSGKTTFLGLVAGVLQAVSGEIRLLGQDFTRCKAAQRDTMRGDHMGYIFQMFNLIPYLTVLENILLPVNLSRVRQKKLLSSKTDATSEAMAFCAALDLKGLEHKNVQELSVGQQQRVAAARALIGGPEILIADEPTSALDFDRREGFLKLLFEQCSRHRTAILFVSHDRSLQPLFDRCVSLTNINSAYEANTRYQHPAL